MSSFSLNCLLSDTTITDWVSIIISAIILIITLFIEPNKPVFYEADPALSIPFRKETISYILHFICLAHLLMLLLQLSFHLF